MRRTLGTAVFSGMLGVTLFGIFLTPVFFYVIQGLGETRLFAPASTRWVGSASPAALLGLAVGFLLARLERRAVRPGRSGRAGSARASSPRCWSWAFVSVVRPRPAAARPSADADATGRRRRP